MNIPLPDDAFPPLTTAVSVRSSYSVPDPSLIRVRSQYPIRKHMVLCRRALSDYRHELTTIFNDLDHERPRPSDKTRPIDHRLADIINYHIHRSTTHTLSLCPLSTTSRIYSLEARHSTSPVVPNTTTARGIDITAEITLTLADFAFACPGTTSTFSLPWAR